MAAASLANFEKLYQFACDVHKNETSKTLVRSWALTADDLRKLIDDRTALYAACVEVSAVGGEATSKALTDAAIIASDLLVGA